MRWFAFKFDHLWEEDSFGSSTIPIFISKPLEMIVKRSTFSPKSFEKVEPNALLMGLLYRSTGLQLKQWGIDHMSRGFHVKN